MYSGQAVINRRTLLTASALGLAGLTRFGTARAAAAPSAAPAKSVILFWLSGGASHIDTWDMKPDAPVEYRGEFKPIATSAPGVRLCEHLPRLSRQAHHLAVVNSLGHYGRGTGDHHAGYYYNLTGREPDPTFRQLLNNRKPQPDDWPFMGAVAASKLPPHPHLPSLIALPQKPGFPEYTRPGQFAARLGSDFDPVYLLGNLDRPTEFSTPALTLEGDVDAERLQSRRQLLQALDGAVREAEQTAPMRQLDRQEEKAFTLLGAPRTRAAFDLEQEPAAVRERYGNTVNGMSLLLARRLVEAEVPFVTVYWLEDPKQDPSCKSGGGWDTHGNNFGCLRNHLLPEFDRCFSAPAGRPARPRPAESNAGAGDERDGPNAEGRRSAFRRRGGRRPRPLDELHVGAASRRRRARRPSLRGVGQDRGLPGGSAGGAGGRGADGVSCAWYIG